MKTKMKLYIFYKMREREDSPLLDVPQRYAITKSKKLRDDFMETRNMKLFHMMELEDTKEKIQELLTRHGSLRLTTMLFNTSYTDVDGVIQSQVVKITGTLMEEEFVYVNAEKLNLELASYTSELARCFKDIYITALHNFFYYEYMCYKYYQTERYTDPFMSGLIGTIDMEKKNSPLNYDTLSVFIYFFGNTMRMR